MQAKATKRLFTIKVMLESGKTKVVKTRAASQAVAERQAMKRSSGVSIVRDN